MYVIADIVHVVNEPSLRVRSCTPNSSDDERVFVSERLVALVAIQLFRKVSSSSCHTIVQEG